MKLFIKNMVCDRCKMAVEDLLARQELHPVKVELGEVDIKESLSKEQSVALQHALEKLGFELIDSKQSRLIEKIKNVLISLLRKDSGYQPVNLSVYLSKELNHDYNSLSHLFSAVEATTIEKYFIRLKTERIKELLIYDEHSISQIADMLGYSSVAHLSNQFKQVTGVTPTHFRKTRDARKPLDKV